MEPVFSLEVQISIQVVRALRIVTRQSPNPAPRNLSGEESSSGRGLTRAESA